MKIKFRRTHDRGGNKSEALFPPRSVSVSERGKQGGASYAVESERYEGMLAGAKAKRIGSYALGSWDNGESEEWKCQKIRTVM